MPENDPTPRGYVDAKFIQITEMAGTLYALDEYGFVWRFDAAKMGAVSTWTKLTNHRTV